MVKCDFYFYEFYSFKKLNVIFHLFIFFFISVHIFFKKNIHPVHASRDLLYKVYIYKRYTHNDVKVFY